MQGPTTLQALNDVSPWISNEHGITDAIFQLLGTFVATITFEACTQGNEANAIPIAVSALATPGTLVTSATAPGIFKTQGGWAGGLKVRARISAYTSGSVVVSANSAES